MNEHLEKTLRRVGDDADDLMNMYATSEQVLDALTRELTPVVAAYKMKKIAPSTQTLMSAAAKLVAVVAATNAAIAARNAGSQPMSVDLKPTL